MKIYVTRFLCIVFFAFVFTGCSDTNTPNTDQQAIEQAMQVFVQTLETGDIDSSTISMKVRTYIESKDIRFFGSTVCLLNTNKQAIFSPYWYKSSLGIKYKDLTSDTSYDINKQEWLVKPIQTNSGVWSAPYFDAGGGDIWMKTYSVPVKKIGVIVAIATTDLQVEKP